MRRVNDRNGDVVEPELSGSDQGCVVMKVGPDGVPYLEQKFLPLHQYDGLESSVSYDAQHDVRLAGIRGQREGTASAVLGNLHRAVLVVSGFMINRVKGQLEQRLRGLAFVYQFVLDAALTEDS